VTSGDIERQAIGQLSAFVYDGLQIGAVRICGQYAAGAEVQEEEPAGLGPFFGSVSIRVEAIALM
jgi:hypothetical protein